ncbi:unnamed protein product [Sphagnum troendelagicum]|uniref:Uncharacterized protein n=1 Tax=Sphagnum troendelagicum TaxID=128251 RepID=A0ABP0UZ33_9BRYO
MRTDVANTPENDARTVDYGRKRPTGRPTRRCRCRYAHVTAAARQSMRRSSGRGDGVACSSSPRLMVLIFLGRGKSGRDDESILASCYDDDDDEEEADDMIKEA